MSNREKVLQRLETAMASLEAAAEKRLAAPAPGGDSNEALQAVTEERDRLAKEVKEQADRNADLGARLDAAIAKLNKVLAQA